MARASLTRTLISASLLVGLAFITKPTPSSFRRVVGARAKQQAGAEAGGLAGWAAGRLTELGLSLAEHAGRYSFDDYLVALVVRTGPEAAEYARGRG
jgi:hypothetical protein